MCCVTYVLIAHERRRIQVSEGMQKLYLHTIFNVTRKALFWSLSFKYDVRYHLVVMGTY